MLAALKREFLPNLEVRDEGEYWETRNLATLAAKRGQIQAGHLCDGRGPSRYGLSREAAEDPKSSWRGLSGSLSSCNVRWPGRRNIRPSPG